MESDRDFVEYFENKVKETIDKHRLLSKKDKVIVAVSGGKDSTTALYVLNKLGYNTEAMLIDQLLGEYSKTNKDNIREFCGKLGLKLHVIPMREEFGCSVCYMKSVLDSKGFRMNTCLICGVMRRSILNRRAREIKATKLVTGHNLDDEAQTFFMNMIQGNLMLSAKLGPSSGVAKNSRFIPRVKPLYYCLEAETTQYSKIMNFPVQYEPCPCSLDSFRTFIKKRLNDLEGRNPGVKLHLVESFLSVLPALKKKFRKTGEVKTCVVCGEPSSREKCKVCSLMELMKTST
jgi:uncharacterized protein (TIGR00269 family)